MWGWESWEIVFASRSKRCRTSGDSERWDGRTLTATARSSRVSRARYTSPIPPAPIAETISYGPSFEPAASVMSGGILRFFAESGPVHEECEGRGRLPRVRDGGQEALAVGRDFVARGRPERTRVEQEPRRPRFEGRIRPD